MLRKPFVSVFIRFRVGARSPRPHLVGMFPDSLFYFDSASEVRTVEGKH
jgi:hypothetical protein